jgi:hypothetical protein
MEIATMSLQPNLFEKATRSLTLYPFGHKTYSMEQSPSWEANRFSAGQEIPRILWSPKVHDRSHKRLLFDCFATW